MFGELDKLVNKNYAKLNNITFSEGFSGKIILNAYFYKSCPSGTVKYQKKLFPAVAYYKIKKSNQIFL